MTTPTAATAPTAPDGPGAPAATPAHRADPRVPLLLFALAVVVGHHEGVLLEPLGTTTHHTRWADWFDLLVPLAVLGSAAAALARAGASRAVWTTFGIGALVYVEGHGIHLAANSVGNHTAVPVAHFWDEVVGHYVWYAGEVVVVVALARAGLAAVPVTAAAWVLPLLFGLTWTTNCIEGGTAVLGIVVSAGLVVWGWRMPLLRAAYTTSLLLLVGWGAWHRGFPQFSELGWI